MKWNAYVGIIVAPVLTILFIWFPFGFELNGLVEEWIILDLFRTHGIFFFATHSLPLPHQSLRPLTILPHAIAYWMEMNLVILLGQFCVRQGIMLVPSAIKLCEQLSNILLKNEIFFSVFLSGECL